MIVACCQFLADVATCLDVPRENVDVGAAALEQHQVTPRFVLIPGRERFERVGQRVAREDSLDRKRRSFRWLYWRRTLPVEVVIDHQDGASADRVLQGLLREVFRGLHDEDNNHVRILADDAIWEADKSVLSGAGAARVRVGLRFVGGVVADSYVPLVADVVPEPDDSQE